MTKLSMLCMTVLLSARLFASEPEVWKADKFHSQVKFSVSHLVISEVSGRFTDFDITMVQPDTDFTRNTI